jgi:DNA gyrase subunit A
LEEKDFTVEKDLSELDQTELLSLMNFNNLPSDSEVFKRGFTSLLQGYVDYAREVLINRAVPDLRDGLKPVQRFALWVLHTSKSKDFQKSEIVSGGIMKYHPHNADSAYESLVRMTDLNGSFNVPLLKGHGSMGRVYSSKPPAARRYTGVKLHPFADEMFTAMDGVKIVPNFDGTATYAEVLPASFPYVLAKMADGIAVGFSTNIPSFNVNDICDLVIEYIEHGECKSKIIPDFPTGGYIVPTEKELDKLMRTGRGKFTVRGRVEIDGKNIYVREVPVGTTIEKLHKEIEEKAEIDGISRASILSDKNGAQLEITCKSKNRVDEVLVQLYNKTSLQHNFNSNILVIQDKKLVMTGVWGIIERWVKWRREVLNKQFSVDLEKVKESIKLVSAFIKLLDTEGAKEEVIDLATHKSDEDAIRKIMEYVDCDHDVADWIIRRRLNQFRDGSKYRKQYEDLMATIKDLEYKLSHLDEVIVSDMHRVKQVIGSQTPRKTEISNTVYKESKDVKDDAQEKVYECYYEIKNGFIKKTTYRPAITEDSIVIQAYSNSMIIALSSEGEIFRVYGDDLEISTASSIGTFIPTYAGLKDTSDTEILWATVVDGRKYVLVYTDGFVGFLDTREFFEGTIKSRYLRNGISEHAYLLTDVREYKPNSAILVETSSGRHALAYLDSIKQKSRTARTRVWYSDEVYDSAIIPISELRKRIPIYEKLLVKKPIVFKGTIDLETDIDDENLLVEIE